MFDRVGDGVVDHQAQSDRQPDHQHRRRGHQGDAQIRVRALGVMGGAVEQFGDVEGHEIVGGGQLALSQPLQGGQGGLDATLGADDVPDHLRALFVAEFKGREHLQVGAHRRQWCTQFMRGNGGEVPRRLQRGLGSILLVADPGEHSLHRLADLDSLPNSPNLYFLGLGLGVDGAGLLGQQPKRVDHDQREEPAHDDGAGNDTATDQQDSPVQFADPALGFGQRRPQCDRRTAHGERSDPVLDPVDGGVGIAVGEFRQYHAGR